MSKGKLIFTLPEEQEEWLTAVNAIKYKILVSEIDEYIRKKLKHEELAEEVYKELEDIRSFINEMCINNAIEL